MTNPQTDQVAQNPTADFMKLFHDFKGQAERRCAAQVPAWYLLGGYVDRQQYKDGTKTVTLIVDRKGMGQGLTVVIETEDSKEKSYLWDTNGDGIPEFFYKGDKPYLFQGDMIDLRALPTQNNEQLEKLVSEFQTRVKQGIDDVTSKIGEQLTL